MIAILLAVGLTAGIAAFALGAGRPALSRWLGLVSSLAFLGGAAAAYLGGAPALPALGLASGLAVAAIGALDLASRPTGTTRDLFAALGTAGWALSIVLWGPLHLAGWIAGAVALIAAAILLLRPGAATARAGLLTLTAVLASLAAWSLFPFARGGNPVPLIVVLHLQAAFAYAGLVIPAQHPLWLRLQTLFVPLCSFLAVSSIMVL